MEIFKKISNNSNFETCKSVIKSIIGAHILTEHENFIQPSTCQLRLLDTSSNQSI